MKSLRLPCLCLINMPLFCFYPNKGLTEHLLQKHLTDYEEVIQKLFSEVSGLEEFPKISDPQVDTRLWALTVILIKKNKQQQKQPTFKNEQTVRQEENFTYLSLPYVTSTSTFLYCSVVFFHLICEYMWHFNLVLPQFIWLVQPCNKTCSKCFLSVN